MQRALIRLLFLLVGAVFVLAYPGLADVYTVNSTGDEPDDDTVDPVCHTALDQCTLRAAIMQANATNGADTIVFNIPGTGVQTIAPGEPLPDITGPVTIDGYTQPGSSPNTDPLATNAVLLVELDGNFLADGLTFIYGSGGSTVQGLVMNQWSGASIALYSGGNTVAGCFLGTDPTGMTAPAPWSGWGIWGQGPSNTIGGAAPADRNLTSGNRYGIDAEPFSGNGWQIRGNLVGVDATGTKALPNTEGGIVLYGPNNSVIGNVISGNTGTGFSTSFSTGTIQGNLIGTNAAGTAAIGNGSGLWSDSWSPWTIGGSAPGEGNVISGNAGSGIVLYNTDGNVILGNLIGTDAAGTADLGNRGAGIEIYVGNDNIIGGVAPGEGNVIAHNGSGVVLSYLTGNTIRGNSIHSNSPSPALPSLIPLGIDLDFDGPTANDPGDADTGANELQNYPFILSAAPAAPQGAGTRVQGVLHSQPSTDYTLDFYYNPACAPRPRAIAQATTYLGTTVSSTDGAGDAAFDVTLPYTIAPGETVTATATDPAGNTSEISPRILFAIGPGNGPSAGGSSVTITGTDFEAGASVSIGGQPASNVVVTDSRTITATTPPLPPGSVGDVTVSNPSGLAGTFFDGWVSDFLDAGGPFYPYIVTLVGNGVTAGCGGGNYCPDANVTRAQMAALLLKGKYGLCFVPPPCTGIFPDVPCPSLFADWIEELASEGITGGCGGGNYCPDAPVTRSQMSAFLLKAEHGSSYIPPGCVGVFADVACPSLFADWIEQLAAEGITGGCGGGNYCPQNPSTRGQMAVFLTKTFNLQ